VSRRGDHATAKRRRGCVWRAVPERRFAELVGCLILGAAVDAPDDVADAALAVAERTLDLVGRGLNPPQAYQVALIELGVVGMLGRWA
jgi:hypothetical protein